MGLGLGLETELRTHDARVRGAQWRELLLCVCVWWRAKSV